MKFRRNIKEEKLFKIVAIVALFLFAILLVCYFITSNEVLLDLIIPLLFIPPLYFLIVNSLKNNFIEFQRDKIIFTNGKFGSIELNISDIKTILIPSPIALKSKTKDNAIIFKGKNINNTVSYSTEIEKYIKENIEVDIEYYDNYNQAIK